MSSFVTAGTQVSESDLLAQNAQNTADEASSGVDKINNPNQLGPAEKQTLKRKYQIDKFVYDMDIKMLTDAGLSTAELQSTMSALDNFITPYFKDMGKTEQVDRDQLNQVFNDFDTADKNASNAFNSMVSNAAKAAKEAGDDAKEAGEKAQEAGEEAKASANQAQVDATQAKADAATAQQKAQSSIDQLNAHLPDIDKALSTANLVKQNVTKLSDTTEQYHNEYTTGIQNVISTVNDMEIGGRNIVLDSSNMGSFRIWQADGNSKLSDDKKEITITTSHGGINIEKKNLSEYLPNKGDTIVISADVKGNSHLQFNYNDGNSFVGSGTSIAVTTEYKRYFTTFEWNPVNLDKTQFVVFAAGSAEQYLTVKNVKVEIGNKGTDWSPAPEDLASQTDITASINNIHLGVKNADSSTATFNMNSDTILLDANKIIFSGNTSILDGTIGTAKIANAAINTAQIADAAINNAKIANAAIDDAKISNLNGNKLVEGSVTANKINVDDLIANGINTKTLTSVNLNTSTLTTPQLNLGLNGTFTEDFDYTQPTSLFLPKKNKGTLTFNHGVLQSEGSMQTYVNGQWGGMNDNLVFQSGINNAQWTEIAPGYLKMVLYKQDGTTVAERTYSDPTGFYYTSMLGNKSYLGNVLQTPQVQTASVLTKYIGPSDGELRLQIGNNGNHYGFQVGSYAGKEAVLSDFIYSATSSHSPDIHITEGGHLVRTTSASKYKYNIKNPDIETTLGDRLLNVHLATWNDKRAVDSYAEQLSTGEEREKSSIDKYYGLIAEQLRDAGLDMFISYGKNHEIEGIQYDRAWVPLLSVIRRLNDKVNEYELRLSKLEGKINE
ncbi:cell envelope integrity protein TolA [Pediococcus pentosaceus]|uniref:cell envelope integrity protein TolA n=1 Tax=Pediococcus pentosaceus TaxID=1255 RepID=UPI00211C3A67|nr:cell envelope integrity protein TolA [Pediococcus pentosaceus]MCQ9315312.1 cell envelope integrity protein TolA [Pediococcus pentosaceus]MCQ9337824.1 cell envelope integrity protein TolA [Pediococcus pentosaceus]